MRAAMAAGPLSTGVGLGFGLPGRPGALHVSGGPSGDCGITVARVMAVLLLAGFYTGPVQPAQVGAIVLPVVADSRRYASVFLAWPTNGFAIVAIGLWLRPS